MVKAYFLFFLLGFTLILASKSASATTYTWTGGASDGGKWTTSANWGVGSGYPGSSGTTDIAQFSSSGTFTVKLTSAITIASLNETSGTTLLTVNTAGFALTINTTITLGSNSSGLTILGSGAVNIAAMTSQNGDFLNCGSASDATTKVTFTGAIITLANNSGNGIFNYGAFNLTTSQLYTGSTSEIYNGSTGTFTATSSLIYLQNGSSSIVNDGTFKLVSSSLYFNVNPCSITNDPTGTFSMNASLMSFSTNNNQIFYNYGTVNATTGSNTITMQSGGSDNTINNYGTFNAGSGASSCTINLLGTRSDINNTSATLSGTTYNGQFNLGSTSIIYPTSTSSQITNAASCTFTLLSDVNGSASIARIYNTTNGATGNFTVQRYVQGGNTYSSGRWVERNYRLMSSQVNEGVDGNGDYPYSLNYLGASTIITDCTSTYATKTGNPSLYFYNEGYTPSNATFISGNFIGVTNISNTAASGHITTTDATNSSVKIYTGEGFMMFFRGNNTTSISGSPSKTSYPYVAPENVTFSTTGLLNQGTYLVKSWTGYSGLLYTTSNSGNSSVRGFNLVGNPYPCSIDWSTFSNSVSSAPIYGAFVNPTVWLFNPTTSNYDTYNATTGITTGSATKNIPSGQGFFVQSNNHSSSLTFNESAKTSTLVTGTNLLLGMPVTQSAYNSYLRLDLATDSIYHTDMVIGFNSTSTTKFNPIEDSEFLPGNAPPQSIGAISSDSVKTSQKWLPFPKNADNQVIRLNVTARATGTYTLQRKDFKAIPKLYEVWLMDVYKKDSLDIRNNTTYVFDIDLSDTASFGNNRFRVLVRQNPALGVHLLNFTGAKVSGGSQIVWKTENEENYTYFTVERSSDGGATFNPVGGVASAALGTYSFLDKTPPAAVDMYRLKIVDINGAVSYSNIVTLMYGSPGSTLVKTGIVVYPNPAKTTLSLSIAPGFQTTSNFSYTIQIANVLGSVVTKISTTQQTWQTDVSSLMPGTYVVQVINKNNNSLVGQSTFIKL